MPFLFPSGLTARPQLTTLPPELVLLCLLYIYCFAFSPASEAPQCPFSRSPSACVNVERSSPALQLSPGGTELPPSYEDIMKENKL